jgi:predicted RND superfamily exporter protein
VTAQGRYASHDRRLSLVMVRPATMADTTSQLRPLIKAVEAEVEKIEAEFQVGSIIGGDPALKMDEVRAAERSLLLSGAASLAGVTVLFYFAFRRRTLPYLGVAGLLCSVVWTFAWATIAVGHLTVVSSSFLAILIGLGVDFAIHITCHFEAARKHIPDPREALLEAAHEAAPGVFTGALTTSAGFFSMLLVGFPAFRGLGVVAGGGILLAVFETFTLLPAAILLVVSKEARETVDLPCPGEEATASLAARLVATPSLGLLVVGGLIAASLSPAWKLSFETNLLALNDPDSPSMRLQDTFLRDFGFTPTMNIVIVDELDELQEVTHALESLEAVGLVDSLARRVPVEPGTREPELARLRELLSTSSRIPPDATSDPERRAEAARKLAERLGALRVLHLARSDPGAAYTAERLRRTLLRLAEADPEAVSVREDEVFQALHDDLDRLRSSAFAPPATVESLPEADRDRYRSDDGRFAIYVAPALDVRQDEEGQRFVASVRAIADEQGATFTGLVPLQRHMVHLLEGGYRDTCLYALLAVMLLLVLDLRRPGLVILVLAVCATGVVTLRASMELHGISLNAANFIAVPLLLGVGVDNAVHLIHPWLRGQTVQEALATSGRPILLNSITSMLGFGGLILADHQGLYSLGWSLAVGVFWCTLATFLLVPGFLQGLVRHRQSWLRDAETLLSDRFT